MAVQDEQQNHSAGSDQRSKPAFNIGIHNSSRDTALSDQQYGTLLNNGVSQANTVTCNSSIKCALTLPKIFFVTTPITNERFRARVFALVDNHFRDLAAKDQPPTSTSTPLLADPIVPPLTLEDVALFPSDASRTYTACVSSWLDFGSTDPFVASISRQVLNLELAYAGFCNVKNILIPRPSPENGQFDCSRYARAIREGLAILNQAHFFLFMPMSHVSAEKLGITLADTVPKATPTESPAPETDDTFMWEAWHQIRSICSYPARLLIGEILMCPSI